MAKFSIDMRRDYEALDCVIKLRNYFSKFAYKEPVEDKLKLIKKLEEKIRDRILEAIRIIGGALLTDPETEVGFG